MLSVRIIEKNNESDTVFEARQVRRHKYDAPKDGFIGEVQIDPVDDAPIVYKIRQHADPEDSQTIYVMNSMGQTITAHHL